MSERTGAQVDAAQPLAALRAVRIPSLRWHFLIACTVLVALCPSTGAQSPDSVQPQDGSPLHTAAGGNTGRGPSGMSAFFHAQTALAIPRRPDNQLISVNVEAAESGTVDSEPVGDQGRRDYDFGSDFASQLPDDESPMIQIVEITQWTIVVLLVAVVAALAVRKYSRGQLLAAQGDCDITHLASKSVRNYFQAHLIDVCSQRFLVTTDRSGVRTVNPLSRWEEFSHAVEEPEPSRADAA